ncbi:transglutaminase-like domain-containing protein [Frateuria defendens]|uniref:transglutaminase-like domain-containing protein n=1 Tax=Frateuria defendens TaxID=2219559 RepID=UPI00066FFE07|nr:transglutaminase-like domain-containing protein [Frateuria defendens]
MLRRIATLLVLACLALAPVAPAAEPDSETIWMSVLLSGRKIGSLQIERRREGDAVTTTQTLILELNRVGTTLRLGSMSRTVEGLDGSPRGFAASNTLSAAANSTEGRLLAPGRFAVTTSVAGLSRSTELALPADALMFEGLRRAMQAAGRRPGTRYSVRQFDPGSQQVVTVDTEVLGEERVALPDGPETLSHQRQHLMLAGGMQTVEVWLDDRGIARKGRMAMVGQPLEMLACSRACAQAPTQRVDMFRAAMVGSPRPLTPNLRAVPLSYRMHVRGDLPQPFVATDEQRVVPLGDGQWLLHIGHARRGSESPPTALDRQPTDWLQSDAPEIRQLAIQAAGKARDDRNRMRRLRSFVSDYITEYGLDVGYASALEVARTRKGDCTEYAVLLAALGRAAGVPTRVVSGMVYADRYSGVLRVFVPHAWVQAWVDGRWESYDAALRRFDATHIALAVGDGDPARFFAAARMFGNLRIDRVAPSADLMDTLGTAPAVAAPSGAGAAGP